MTYKNNFQSIIWRTDKLSANFFLARRSSIRWKIQLTLRSTLYCTIISSLSIQMGLEFVLARRSSISTEDSLTCQSSESKLKFRTCWQLINPLEGLHYSFSISSPNFNPVSVPVSSYGMELFLYVLCVLLNSKTSTRVVRLCISHFITFQYDEFATSLYPQLLMSRQTVTRWYPYNRFSNLQ